MKRCWRAAVFAAAVLVVCSTGAGTTSIRQTHAEYAAIRDVVLFVAVGPMQSYPDADAARREAAITSEVVKAFAAHGRKAVTGIAGSSALAPVLAVDVTLERVPDTRVYFLRTRLELREYAVLERLKGVAVCHRATTWSTDEVDHVDLDEGESRMHEQVTEAVARLIDEMEFTDSSLAAGRRTRG